MTQVEFAALMRRIDAGGRQAVTEDPGDAPGLTPAHIIALVPIGVVLWACALWILVSVV